MSGVTRPENWRVLTPIFGVLNFMGIVVVGIIGYFSIRTIDQFDIHLNHIDMKFEEQARLNSQIDHNMTVMQSECCPMARFQSQTNQ